MRWICLSLCEKHPPALISAWLLPLKTRPETLAGITAVRISAAAARVSVSMGQVPRPRLAQTGLAWAPRIASALHLLRASRLWRLSFSQDTPPVASSARRQKTRRFRGGKRGAQIKRKARTFAPNLFMPLPSIRQPLPPFLEHQATHQAVGFAPTTCTAIPRSLLPASLPSASTRAHSRASGL